MEYTPHLFGFQNPHTEIITELEKTSKPYEDSCLSEMAGRGNNKPVVSWWPAYKRVFALVLYSILIIVNIWSQVLLSPILGHYSSFSAHIIFISH